MKHISGASDVGANTNSREAPGDGYENFKNDGALFEVGDDDDDEPEEAVAQGSKGGSIHDEARWGEIAESPADQNRVVGNGVERGRATSDATAMTTGMTLTSIKDPLRSSRASVAPPVRAHASGRLARRPRFVAISRRLAADYPCHSRWE